jgi:sorting nexin-13
MNELIIYLMNNKNTNSGGGNLDNSNSSVTVTNAHSAHKGSSQGCQVESRNLSQESSGLVPANSSGMRSLVTHDGDKSKMSKIEHGSAIQSRQPDWAVGLDAATKRRSQVLAPENLENMWAIGRNYQKKMVKFEHSRGKSSGIDNIPSAGAAGKELSPNFNERITSVDDKYMVNLMQGSNRNAQSTYVTGSHPLVSQEWQDTDEAKPNEGSQVDCSSTEKPCETINNTKAQLKRSNSTPDIEKRYLAKSNQTMVSSEIARKNQGDRGSFPVSHGEVVLYVPKIRCRVVGAYFEKLSSKSFAVYSIAVTDAENKAWFVKRRYRNFERLHRQLKEIPNYSLHLPPKSFLSSSIDDYLVHQRCILLDKYLQVCFDPLPFVYIFCL